MPQFNILLIEDDDITAGLVRFLVERQGHQLHWATDGRQGQELLASLKPDALILDLLLPYVDGLSLLKEIRVTDNDMPVLVLTGKTRESDLVEVLDAGANDYLAKPFHPSELTARLNRLLRYL